MIRKLRDDRGSIINALVFILISTGLVVSMIAFLMLRTSGDYAEAQRAQVKSAIDHLASKVLGRINADFPVLWATADAAALRAETTPIGTLPSSSATAYVTYFAVNPETAVVIADITGDSGTTLNVTVRATVQFVPSGAGVFTGLDLDRDNRPTWVYSNENLESLALWEMNPSATLFIDPGGAYDVATPDTAPTVRLTATGVGADGTVDAAACRFTATAQYQTQSQVSPSESWSLWSTWSARPDKSFTLTEGAKVDFRARMRCVSDTESSNPSPTGASATYVRPIETVASVPIVSITVAGLVSWPAASCAPGTAAQYAHRYRVNTGVWSTPTEWSSGRAFTVAIPLGGRLDVEVTARCATAYAFGPASAPGVATRISPLLNAPAAPSVVLSGSVHAVIYPTACPSPSTPQLRSHYALNGASLADAPWGAWGAGTQRDVAAGYGQRVSFAAQQRCVTDFAESPASLSSAPVVRDVPIPSAPVLQPISIFASGASWGEASCPAPSVPKYLWQWKIDGGAVQNSGTSWRFRPSSVPFVFANGSTASVAVRGVCAGYAVYGPLSPWLSKYQVSTIPIAPNGPYVSIADNGVGSWSASGCPSGTAPWYVWQSARNLGVSLLPRVQVGSGWQVFNSIFGAGDFNGDGRQDVLARDSAGYLWMYPGNGGGGWLPPVKVGSGWQGFNSIFGAGDFNGDGHQDVMARDSAGYLWMYPGNGGGGWLPRVQVDTGWNIFSALFGVGDFNGDGHQDVMARDSAGVLWLYHGTGSGSWSAWSAWGTVTSAWIPSYQGDGVAYQVGARCRNTYSGVLGPARWASKSIYRSITTPAKPSGFVVNGDYYGINWNKVSCPAGTVDNYWIKLYQPGIVYAEGYTPTPSYAYPQRDINYRENVYEQFQSYCRNTTTGKLSPRSAMTGGYWPAGGYPFKQLWF